MIEQVNTNNFTLCEENYPSKTFELPGKNSRFYSRYIKLILDFILSTCAAIIFSPVLLFTAIVVRVKLGSPVIFKQDRVGKDEKVFTLYKFRTMTNDVDMNGNLQPDDIRLTKLGRLLRATSLDELPELINIMKGDMSIVGPRPLLIQYLNFYNVQQKRRHEVKPGLTGYAQINGRNSITWEEKFDYDVYYVDHITFSGDWKIIFSTVKKVLYRDGVSSITLEPFRGTKVRDNVDVKTG